MTATPDQLKELTRFYKEWRNALEQLESWQSDAKLKEARFKGAAEFVFGGTNVTFNYDEASGELTFTSPNHKSRK